MWADKENYFSSFSDIQFDKRGTRFYNADAHFISFFNIGEDISYCIGAPKITLVVDVMHTIISITINSGTIYIVNLFRGKD